MAPANPPDPADRDDVEQRGDWFEGPPCYVCGAIRVSRTVPPADWCCAGCDTLFIDSYEPPAPQCPRYIPTRRGFAVPCRLDAGHDVDCEPERMGRGSAIPVHVSALPSELVEVIET